MHFIHANNDLRAHGNLQSSNLVVDGRFVLKGLEEETYSVVVEAPGYQHESTDISAGRDEVSIVLQRRRTISGRLLLEDGNPAGAGVPVKVSRAEPAEWRTHMYATPDGTTHKSRVLVNPTAGGPSVTFTTRDGTFKFVALNPGRYDIRRAPAPIDDSIALAAEDGTLQLVDVGKAPDSQIVDLRKADAEGIVVQAAELRPGVVEVDGRLFEMTR